MKFLSVCSGIEAASVAWHPLGWESVAYSEIEPFPCKVLAHHYPDVPNLGDMTKFKEWPDADVDVFVGGTPCQSFSVAGLRKGLDDPRGNLMLTYLAIAKRYRPNWLVWENVPGVLSSAGGRDFGSLLGGLAVLGYGFAYRVLDAQYFGVAQRRKRVFVVGYLGDWRPAAAVLFERHSLQGHPAPSREKRKETPSPTGASLDVSCVGTLTAGFGKVGAPEVDAYTCIPAMAQPIPLNSMNVFRGVDADASTGCGIGEAGEAMFTISKAHSHAVAQPIAVDIDNTNLTGDVVGNLCAEAQSRTNKGMGVMQAMAMATHDVAGTMLSRKTSGGFSNSIDYAAAGYMALQAMAVRRLTPVECERLQGFPDRYTDIQPKSKPTPDGPRYKALGNSMAVPVMGWIGKRIQEVDAILKNS
jgi:DNA (cytosine-5)-methyltransferase 1